MATIVGSSCGLRALTWPLQRTVWLGRPFARDEEDEQLGEVISGWALPAATAAAAAFNSA